MAMTSQDAARAASINPEDGKIPGKQDSGEKLSGMGGAPRISGMGGGALGSAAGEGPGGLVMATTGHEANQHLPPGDRKSRMNNRKSRRSQNPRASRGPKTASEGDFWAKTSSSTNRAFAATFSERGVITMTEDSNGQMKFISDDAAMATTSAGGFSPSAPSVGRTTRMGVTTSAFTEDPRYTAQHFSLS